MKRVVPPRRKPSPIRRSAAAEEEVDSQVANENDDERPPEKTDSAARDAESQGVGNQESEGADPEKSIDANAKSSPKDEVSSTAASMRRRIFRYPAVRVGSMVLLAVLLVGGLSYAAVQFFAQRAEDHARTAAREAAEHYAVELSSYDFENLENNFDEVEQNATGEFGEQYRQVSQNLTELIEQHEAESEGSVLSAGVAESSSEHAVVLLFVDQTITNTNNPEPRIDRNRMQMNLVHEDDRWLIDDVKLL